MGQYCPEHVRGSTHLDYALPPLSSSSPHPLRASPKPGEDPNPEPCASHVRLATTHSYSKLPEAAYLRTAISTRHRTPAHFSLTLNSLLPDDGSEKGGARDALGLFEGAVECRRKRASSGADLARYGEDGVECPWGALHEPVVCVVAWVEERDKDVATGEESVEGCLGMEMKVVR